jgi:putative transposase
MAQQARNLCMFFDELPDRPKYIVCDQDTKFTAQFEEILKIDNIELKRTAVRAPNQNAYAERWVQSIKQECLDLFVVFGEKHLRHIIHEYVFYYHDHRPHQALGNLPPTMNRPPHPIEHLGPKDVVRHERLRGLLAQCHLKVALSCSRSRIVTIFQCYC